METAYELKRCGLANGDGEQIARRIDQLTALPDLIDTLVDLFLGAREESDARAFQRYVAKQTGAALERAGFEFSYFENDSSRLHAMRDRLREGRP
jgi:hypothetical protein